MTRRLRMLLLGAAVVAVVGYAGIAVAMYTMQRDLLFNVRDTGNLAEPHTLAIEGSERVQISTPDGERLAAWYLPPQPGRPVFLFLHGKGGGWNASRGGGSAFASMGKACSRFRTVAILVQRENPASRG